MRKSQFKIQKELEQKAQRWANKIVKLPFVRIVVLTGSVARNETTEKSDIDFFIQLAPRRLYIGRLIVTLAVHLWGERRTDKNIAGKLCLNWFGTKNYPRIRFQTDSNFLYQVLAVHSRQNAIALKSMIVRFVEIILGIFEGEAKRYQVKRFKKDPRIYARGSQVRWSDEELGFHPVKTGNTIKQRKA